MAKKYIDADLLRKEIEKRLKNIRDYMSGTGMRYKGPKYFKAQGKESAYDALLSIIVSLQQEQPEQPTRGYDEAYLNEKIAKATKSWKGVDVDKFMDDMRGREPEVDLEKETKRWWKEHLHLNPENQLWMDAHQSVVFARHFAEWGAERQKKQDEKEQADLFTIVALDAAQRVKEQMMKDAVEGIARPDDCEIWVNLVGYGYKFNDGDKVKLIVIKED